MGYSRKKKQTGESKVKVILFGVSPHLEFLGYFSSLETLQNFVITPIKNFKAPPVFPLRIEPTKFSKRGIGGTWQKLNF